MDINIVIICVLIVFFMLANFKEEGFTTDPVYVDNYYNVASSKNPKELKANSSRCNEYCNTLESPDSCVLDCDDITDRTSDYIRMDNIIFGRYRDEDLWL